jgi:MFS family permease
VIWPRDVTPVERRSLIAGGLGWMLDAMDVMLYSLVLAHLIRELGMDKATAGSLNSLTLAASALGGLLFGYRPEHRGRALGIMQSSWAIGEILAAGLVALVLPRYGWRAVFFAGVLPALVVLWIRRGAPESALWERRQGPAPRVPWARLWQPDVRGPGLLATAMNAFSMFGYWGLFTWIPAYLSLPVDQGGRGLDLMKTTAWLVVMGVGKWLGYVSFGVSADLFGRRRSYVAFLLTAAVLVPLFGLVRDPAGLLVLGPLVAFFGTGYFSGFGALTAELFPTEARATAMGLTYNVGRGFSALAPWVVGLVAGRAGLGSAFLVLAGAFLMAGLLASRLPETRGKVLD